MNLNAVDLLINRRTNKSTTLLSPQDTIFPAVFPGTPLYSFHPEFPDGNYWFSIRKRGFFSPGQEIKGLRGGVHQYAAQVSPQIDAARTKKDRFRMKTNGHGHDG